MTITTAYEFRQAREALGLSVEELASLLGVKRVETIRQRWESEFDDSKRVPNPVACRVLEWMQNDTFPRENSEGGWTWVE